MSDDDIIGTLDYLYKNIMINANDLCPLQCIDNVDFIYSWIF